MRIAVAQLAPVWLDRAGTITKILTAIDEAAEGGADLICFGETLLPGYPFWVDVTDGARFNSSIQKEIFARYLRESVNVSAGDLAPICKRAKECGICLYLGIAERSVDRGGNTIYCSLVFIDGTGRIGSVHRKLMPTYEERLVWGIGDGHGLQVHEMGDFRVGGLNCWENWMPLARTALYGQGETLHVMTWPGSLRHTIDLTRHVAREGRMYVVSVSGLMQRDNVGDVPFCDEIRAGMGEMAADGGSCVSGPDGEWVLEPQVGSEGVFFADLDIEMVREERHNFDVCGHYSRPDVLRLMVDRSRQVSVEFVDED